MNKQTKGRVAYKFLFMDIVRLGGKGVKPMSKKNWTTQFFLQFLPNSGPECSLFWGGVGGGGWGDSMNLQTLFSEITLVLVQTMSITKQHFYMQLFPYCECNRPIKVWKSFTDPMLTVSK